MFGFLFFQDKPPPWDWLPSSVCMAAWKHRLSRSMGIRHKKSWASQVFLWHQDSPQNAAFPHFFWRFHQPFCDYSTHKDCNFFRQQQAIIDIEFVGVMRLLKASNLGKQFFHQTLWLPWTKTYKSKPMHNLGGFENICEYVVPFPTGERTNLRSHLFKTKPIFSGKQLTHTHIRNCLNM